MAVPTLQNGDIWSDSLANASIRPQYNPNGDNSEDFPGYFDPLPDAALTSLPNNIKPRFYSWFDRLKLTNIGGLELTYQGCQVRLTNGNLVNLSASSIFLAPNTSGFIFLAQVGNSVILQASASLPNECLPLAVYNCDASAVTSLVDSREQSVAVIRPQSLPTTTSPWSSGDIKISFRPTIEPGWIEPKGQTLDRTIYTGLFDAFGYFYGGSGNNFVIPDLRDRTIICTGSQPVGSLLGSDTSAIQLSNMPSHDHGVIDRGHTHGFNDVPHSHNISDLGHNHTLVDPGHRHRVFENANRALIPVVELNQTGAEVSSRGGGGDAYTTTSDSNIRINPTGTGITIVPSSSLGSVQLGITGVSTANNGGNQPISVIQRSIVARIIMKV